LSVIGLTAATPTRLSAPACPSSSSKGRLHETNGKPDRPRRGETAVQCTGKRPVIALMFSNVNFQPNERRSRRTTSLRTVVRRRGDLGKGSGPTPVCQPRSPHSELESELASAPPQHFVCFRGTDSRNGENGSSHPSSFPFVTDSPEILKDKRRCVMIHSGPDFWPAWSSAVPARVGLERMHRES
jgi:hypothetical protein